jgi:tetratricopeptide (TPR) repeat protein
MIKKYVHDGIEHLNASIKFNENFAESHALLGSMLGQKIGISPWRAFYLGPRSGSAIKKAVEIEPQNPRAYLIAGISALFTPKIFGGGENKSRLHLEKAARLFEEFQPESPIFPDWGHEEAYAWLGIVASRMDSLDLAEYYFKKSLDVNPDFGWVKYHLLPEIQKKMDEKSMKKPDLP